MRARIYGDRDCITIHYLPNKKTDRKNKWCLRPFSSHQTFKTDDRKSHTCEEGGIHLRISVWHLLMNLKNNYLLKKLLKWVNKKCKNFNIYNVVFLKKTTTKSSWRYHYSTPVYPKILMI